MRPPPPNTNRPITKHNHHYPDAVFDNDLIAFVHRCTVIGRWIVVLLLWLSLGIPALWFLRSEISLWRENFTWVALWYSFRAHPWPSFALALCLGMLLATLVWQSRNIIWGLSARELDQVQRYARHLQHQRTRSTLWLWFRITTHHR